MGPTFSEWLGAASVCRTCPTERIERHAPGRARAVPGRARRRPRGTRPATALVGINQGCGRQPSTPTSRVPGNRFGPPCTAPASSDRLIDASRGPRPPTWSCWWPGVGITNIVNVATARPDELTVESSSRGRRPPGGVRAGDRPRVVGVLGLTAYRQAFGQPRAVAGGSPRTSAVPSRGSPPNPSGLNARVAGLAGRRLPRARGARACRWGRP